MLVHLGHSTVVARKFREQWEMAGNPCHLDMLADIKQAALEDDSEGAAAEQVKPGLVLPLGNISRYNETRRKERRDNAAPSVSSVQQNKRLKAIDDCAAALEIPDSKRDAFRKMVVDFAEAGETATGAGVGARLLRQLSPAQLAALLEESPLGHALSRYERQLHAAKVPASGFFQSKEQANAAASLGQALRDLQNVEAGFGLPLTENAEVKKAESKATTYRRTHDPATGAFVPPRPRGRPRRNPAQEVASISP